MDPWTKAEFEYAKKLKECSADKRKALYAEAYGTVSALHNVARKNKDPEKRTAGTSPKLVKRLAKICSRSDRILEVGAGRGYTCMKLAAHVESMVGIEVSEPSFNEAKNLVRDQGLENVQILHSSAQDLTTLFNPESFDKVISIDVIEHLHPDDAHDHIEQVYRVLKPGGCYIVHTPNRINGPHDVTSVVYPESREPIGFHLNEVTYSELKRQMNNIGFNRFKSFLAFNRYGFIANAICYPALISIFLERLYKSAESITLARKILSHFIGIKLIAYK